MTIPVYTAMTEAQAAAWVQRLAPKAALLLREAAKDPAVPPAADACMTFLLAAAAMAKGGGFKLREFVAVLETLGVDLG